MGVAPINRLYKKERELLYNKKMFKGISKRSQLSYLIAVWLADTYSMKLII